MLTRVVFATLTLFTALRPALAFAPSPASVSLALSANPVKFGTPETITATVTPSGASGIVTFYDSGSVLATRPVGNGQAAFTTILLAAGAHSLSARYNGDANDAPAVSPVQTLTVLTESTQDFRAPVPVSAAATEPVFPFPVESTVADVNGDGKPDLVTLGPFNGTSPLEVFFGNGDGTFQPPAIYNVNLIGPYFAIGDVNEDGSPDIVFFAAKPSGGYETDVLLNNGAGAFTSVTLSSLAGSGPIAIGDFNLDGKPDVAFTASPSLDEQALVVLLGNGDGTFQSPSIGVLLGTPSSTYQFQLAAYVVADFNGDGKPDLLLNPNDGENPIQVVLGNGDGTFGQPIATPLFPGIIYVADFNADGKPDLLSQDFDSGSLNIALGNGDGTFGDPIPINPNAPGTLSSPRYQITGVTDFNADGKLDIALLQNGFINLLYGNGDGTFAPLAQTSAPTALFPELATGQISPPGLVADLNGDSRPDVVVISYLSNPTEVFLGGLESMVRLTASPSSIAAGGTVTLTATVSPATPTGSVSFFDGPTLLGTASISGGAASITTTSLPAGKQFLTAVYNGDAATLPSTSAAAPVSVAGTTSSVSLSPSPNPVTLGQRLTLTAAVTPADAFGSVNFSDAGNLIGSEPLSNGTASLTTTLLAGGPHLIAAQYSGNSTVDPSVSPPVTVIVNAETTSAFQTPATTYGLTSTPTLYAIGDFNADGKEDIILAASGAAPQLFLGNGDGTLQAPQPLLPTSAATALATCDCNHDGKTDLLVGQIGQFSLLLGNGDGTFQAPFTVAAPASGAVTSFATADFNNDGNPDLAVLTTTQTLIFFGDGLGTFRQAASLPSYFSALAGDFDGDGIQDLAVGGLTLNLLFGNGDGTFRPGPVYPSVPQIVSVGPLFAADFNGDGKVDIAAGYEFSEALPIVGFGVQVFLANGDGTFTPAAPAFEVAAVSVGDFNADGKLDILGTTAILLGNGDGTFQLLSLAESAYRILAAGHFTASDRPSVIDVNPDSEPPSLGIGSGALQTTISVTASATSTLYGQTITFTATVTPSSATGTVTFSNGLAVLGTAPLVNGVATLAISNLPKGTAYVSAAYSGDAFDVPVIANPITITISGLPTTTLLTSSVSAGSLGQSITLTATVTPNTASGAVAFYANAIPLGTAAVNNGVAVLKTPFLAGVSTVTAIYSGDNGNAISVSGNVLITVSETPSSGFSAPTLLPTSAPSAAVVTADFNRDGVPDLAVAGAGFLLIFLGNGDGTFRTGSTIPITAEPTPLVAADFNIDGNQDVAVGGDIYFGNGDGTFQSVPVQTFAGTVALDLNNDAVSDEVFFEASICFLGCQPPVFTVGLGKGDGTFITFATYQITPNNNNLYPGDFNSDGKVDFALSISDSAVLLLGNGDGSFQLIPVNASSGFQPLGVGDFNKDGKLDLVGSVNGQLAVLPGNGDGTFAPALISTSAIAANIVPADVNGDGNLDLLQMDPNSPNPVSVYFGNGDGTFQAPQQFATGSAFHPGAYVAADFNGDGKLDLAVVDGARNDLQILLGAALTTLSLSASSNPVMAGANFTLTAALSPPVATGSVTFFNGSSVLGSSPIVNGVATLTTAFSSTGTYFLSAAYSGTAANGAANASTLALEVIGSNTSAISLAVAPNAAALGQTITLTATVPGATSGQVTFYDGSQLIGIVPVSGGTAVLTTALLSAGAHDLYAMFDNGINLAPGVSPTLSVTVTESAASTGIDATPLQISTSGVAALTTADFNADGKPDIAVADANGKLQVLLGTGNGEFIETSVIADAVTTPDSVSLVSGDFHGDGVPDVALTATWDAAVVLNAGSTSGELQPGAAFSTGAVYPVSLVAADFNRDGKLDTAAGGLGGIALLLGAGDGTFASPQVIATTDSPTALAAADFNGDGIPDIAALTSAGIEIHLGAVDGTFVAAPPIVLTGAQYLVVGDLNGDGRPDLVVETSGFTVLLGNGDGTFQAPQTFNSLISPFVPGPLLIADLNGDGFLDLASGNQTATVSVLYGNGDGTFGQATEQQAYSGITALTSGNFRGDGRTALLAGFSNPVAAVQTLIQAPVFFSDVASTSSYFPFVELLEETGITGGCGTGLFCPNENTTRAQIAVFLVRAILGNGSFSYSQVPYFNDVPPGAFAFAYIQKLYELGLTSGCGGGNFCPGDLVTRAEAAVFIIRGRYGAANPFPYSTYPIFADVPFNSFGFADIQRLAEDGITDGCSSVPVQFCPNDPVTREQVAVLIERGLLEFVVSPGGSLPLQITSVTPSVVTPGQSGTIAFSVAGYVVNPTVVDVGGITFGVPQPVSPLQYSVSFTVDPNAAALPQPLWISYPGSTEPEAILPNAIMIE